MVKSRSVALWRVFDLKFNAIHLAKVIQGLFVDESSSMYMYLYVKLNRDANCFLPVESKDCRNSASNELRKYVV